MGFDKRHIVYKIDVEISCTKFIKFVRVSLSLSRIIFLIISMAILLCKLSELDPSLRPWLSWQPWCRIICKYS